VFAVAVALIGSIVDDHRTQYRHNRILTDNYIDLEW